MNIYTSNGEKVRLKLEANQVPGLEHAFEEARKVIDPGREYEVNYVSRSSSYSLVYLKNIGAYFNTKLFENVSENPKTDRFEVDPMTFEETYPKHNIRYDFDAHERDLQVLKKIIDHETHRIQRQHTVRGYCSDYEHDVKTGVARKNWSRAPTPPEFYDEFYAKQVQAEKNHYAKVRVIELPQNGKRFVLVYGDINDATVTSGTGPFETLEKAFDWFLNGGR